MYSNLSTWHSLIAIFAIMVVIFLALFIVAAYVVSALALQRLFRRAGLPTPGAAWVPFWNLWLLFELGGQHGAWSLLTLSGSLSLIPYIGDFLSFVGSVAYVVVLVFVVINLNKATGRNSTGWHVFGALLNTIWIWVIGFGANTHPFIPQARSGPFFPGSPMPRVAAYPPPGYLQGYPQQPYGYPADPQQYVPPQQPTYPPAPQSPYPPRPTYAAPPTSPIPPGSPTPPAPPSPPAPPAPPTTPPTDPEPPATPPTQPPTTP